jgi:hypothetical protein
MKGNVLVLIFGAIVTLGFFSGCDYDSVISQERAAEGFDGIALAGAGDVNVHFSENFNVIVTTDSDLQDKVVTAVEGNTLRITQRSRSFNARELTIDVYMPELKSISLTGAGDIKINGGNASRLDIALSGAGDIKAHNFQVQNVTVKHSGVGNVKIWATNTLTGNLSGVGDILYRGSPRININRTGVGKIRPL